MNDIIDYINDFEPKSFTTISHIVETTIEWIFREGCYKEELENYEFWLVVVQTLKNRIRKITGLSKFWISDLNIIKMITLYISIEHSQFNPNLKQIMNRIEEKYKNHRYSL